MAIVFNSGFETGALADWSSLSPSPPTVISTDKWSGTYAMQSDITTAAQYAIHTYAVEPAVAVVRFMFQIDAVGSSSFNSVLCQTYNQVQSGYATFYVRTDGSGNPSVFSSIFQASALDSPTSTATLSVGTWYRFEAKVDMSGSAWAITWGIATGNGSLSTVETAYTGGNTLGASTADVWSLGQQQQDNRILLYDDVSVGGASGDYPIGQVAADSTSARDFTLLGVS